MTDLLPYQEKAYQTWKDNGFYGIIEAPTGAGKTKIGVDCIRQFLVEHPNKKILVLTTSKKVVQQWIEELDRWSITVSDEWDSPKVMTYQMAVNKMYRGGLTCDCLIADECQHLATPAHGKVMLTSPQCILGLSATPEESKAILGEPFYSIGIDEARICPFTIHMVKFTPTEEEQRSYDKATFKMECRALDVTEAGWCTKCLGTGTSWKNADNETCDRCNGKGHIGGKKYLQPGYDREGWGSYDALVRQRREVCYSMPSRIPITVALVKKHYWKPCLDCGGRGYWVADCCHSDCQCEPMNCDECEGEGKVETYERIVIFTERTKDAHKIEQELIKEGIQCSMFVKDKDTLKDFEEHKTNVLIMVKSLREGWDDPTLSVCIMNSLSTRPKILTQTMGRTMRIDPNNPDKHAHNYLLIAEGTSDENVRGSLKYPKRYFIEQTAKSATEPSELSKWIG